MTPRQNRITPMGDIIAHPARGALMGNRGCLHDAAGRIVRPFSGRRWISCVLSFKGRRRTLMQPGHYTELFFLDEPTALAAGHRPCADCRRADYVRFRDAWAVVFGDRPGADAMDRRLHAERTHAAARGGSQRVVPARTLPHGAMALIDGVPHSALAGAAHPWRPDGYGPPRPWPAGDVPVLTPAPILAVLAAGYAPLCHSGVAIVAQDIAAQEEPPP